MGSIVKCFLQTPRTFFEGPYARGLAKTYVLLQDLYLNKLLILSPGPFTYHKSHASLDSKRDLLSTVIERREEEFDADQLKKISDILNCSVERAEMFCRKHEFLTEMSLNLLEEKVNLVRSYGVPYGVIQTNLRIAKHVSLDVLQKRLKLLQGLSLLNHRYAGFYLYCTRREFERGLPYLKECQEALEGCADIVEYVQLRLNVSEMTARSFLSTSPFMREYSPLRLKKLFDFFYFEAGVDAEYLLQYFVLFNYSPDRLRDRLKIMRRAGIKEPIVWNRYWRCTPRRFNEVFAEYI